MKLLSGRTQKKAAMLAVTFIIAILTFMLIFNVVNDTINLFQTVVLLLFIAFFLKLFLDVRCTDDKFFIDLVELDEIKKREYKDSKKQLIKQYNIPLPFRWLL